MGKAGAVVVSQFVRAVAPDAGGANAIGWLATSLAGLSTALFSIVSARVENCLCSTVLPQMRHGESGVISEHLDLQGAKSE